MTIANDLGRKATKQTNKQNQFSHPASDLSYKTRGHVYSSCVRSAMLHASETWPLTKTNLQHLQCNDRAMIRQICSIKPEDVARVRSSKLLAKLQLEDLDLNLRERRLRWFGHVERSTWCNQNSI